MNSFAPDPSYLMLQSDLAAAQLKLGRESAHIAALETILERTETEIAALWTTLRRRDTDLAAVAVRAELERKRQGALLAELVAALRAVEFGNRPAYHMDSTFSGARCAECHAESDDLSGHDPRCIVGLALAHAAAIMKEEAK